MAIVLQPLLFKMIALNLFNKTLTIISKLSSIEKKKVIFSFLFPSLLVCLLWLVKIIELQFDLDFSPFGILPRNFIGLRGVFLSPLIHGDIKHLFNNSVPLIVLGASLYYFYKELAFKITAYSWLLSGLYTWISARYAVHIGASGLVYALFGFLLISGFIRKNTRLIAISFLSAFLYGSLIWGILPWDKTMSWEGHFWGLLIGIVLAFYFRKKGPQKKKYSWDLEEEEEPPFDDWKVSDSSDSQPPIKVVYHFKEGEKEKD